MVAVLTLSEQPGARLHDVRPVRRLRSVDAPAQVDSNHAESALVGRVAAGDQDAFAEVYQLVASRVFTVVLRVVRDQAQSEEVTQEVMLELWRTAGRFDSSRGSVRTWATTVAHRRAVDRVRSSQSARDRDKVDLTTRPQPTGDSDVVGDAVEAKAQGDIVSEALAHLSDAQRESIELAYFGGHTYREVAAELDVPEGTVKTRIRDGLKNLRASLEDRR